MKTIRSLIATALFATVLSLGLALSPDASAQTTATAPAVTTPAATPAPTPAASPTAPVVASTPWYANAELWTGLFGFVAAVFGVVRNAQLSTHQKINQALVLGIEQATAIPAVAKFESTIKQTIQAKATAWGVQPILDRIVQDLTADKPAATTTTAPV